MGAYKTILKDTNEDQVLPVTKASAVMFDGTSYTVENMVNSLSQEQASMKANFQAGCSTIASAITAGRDGQGAGGVNTASNATPTVMAGNIKTMAQKNYDQGYADALKILLYEDVEFDIPGSTGNTTTGTYTVSHDIEAACVLSITGAISIYTGGVGATVDANCAQEISWSGKTITISQYINGWNQGGKTRHYKVRYYYWM